MMDSILEVRCKLLGDAKHKGTINFGPDRFAQEGYSFLKRFRQIWQRRGCEIDPVLSEQGDRLLEEPSAKVRVLSIEVRQGHQLIGLSGVKRIIVFSHIFERAPYHV